MSVEPLPSGVVTFLLTDIEGSTALWERSAPAMDRALARHDAVIGEAVRAHGGRLLKTKGEGDATFSVFVRATDAVLAARECQRALAAEEWPDGTALRVRCALVTGEAVERDGDYYGTTVNRAARLRSLAKGGEVLVAQSTVDVTLDHLPGGVRLVDVGERVLRDLARPEHVWRLVDAPDATPIHDERVIDVRVPFPPVLASVTGPPLVGREHELDRLRRLLAGDGRRLVWVRGEPGIGKTRLVAELAREAQRHGSVVLYGRCEDELGAPYQPFVEALRHWVTHAGTSLGAVAGRGLVHLGHLLPEVADASAPGAVADAERYAVFEAVDELLTSIAAVAPLVVVLDDLHWADRSSLLLLRHLARSGRGARLTIVATYRDTELDRTHPLADALADLRRGGPDERIDVGGLDAPDVARLVANLGVTLDPSALAAVSTETEGNPFFVSEVARHLAEAGPAPGTVPEGVREVVGRRLSRLSPLANEALTVAAVVGRDFTEAVVEAAGGPTGEPLRAALEEATGAHVLDEVPGALGHYRFAHALIRQTLVSELSINRRVRLHWAAGQALAALQPADVDAIAHHLTEGVLAGDPLVAADASLAAAAAATGAAAWDEAATHFRCALDMLDQAALDAPERRYRAQLGLGDVSRRLGEYRATRRAALEAVALAREHGWAPELARAVRRATDVRSLGSRRAADLALIDEALAAIGEGDSVERVLLSSIRVHITGVWAFTEADYRAARTRAEANVAMADRLDDPVSRLTARSNLAAVIAGKGAADERAAVARQAAAILDDAFPGGRGADFFHLQWVANLLGGAGREVADPAMVAEGAERVTQLLAVREAPWPRRGLTWWGVADALAAGRTGEAAALLDDLLALAADDVSFTLLHWDLETLRIFELGDVDTAVARVAGELAGGVGDHPEMVLELVAFQAASCHDDDACRAALAEALARGVPWTTGRPRALWAAAEAAARLGDAAAAAELLPLLVPYDGAMLASYEGHTVNGSAATALGQVEAVLGEHDAADAHFRSGVEVEERMGYAALAARTRLWWARSLLARGRPDDRGTAARLLDRAAAAGNDLGLGLLARDVAHTGAAG